MSIYIFMYLCTCADNICAGSQQSPPAPSHISVYQNIFVFCLPPPPLPCLWTNQPFSIYPAGVTMYIQCIYKHLLCTAGLFSATINSSLCLFLRLSSWNGSVYVHYCRLVPFASRASFKPHFYEMPLGHSIFIVRVPSFSHESSYLIYSEILLYGTQLNPLL